MGVLPRVTKAAPDLVCWLKSVPHRTSAAILGTDHLAFLPAILALAVYNIAINAAS